MMPDYVNDISPFYLKSNSCRRLCLYVLNARIRLRVKKNIVRRYSFPN